MSGPVHLARRGAAIVATIDSPPVNALSVDVRAGLQQLIVEADAEPACRAIVIFGAGRGFSGGADIREFGAPQAPSLHDLIETIERSHKPVVAAIRGMALGGGLELALACHGRVATPDAQLGLPEVKLGLLPGAGGTQRLPRLVGYQTALDMMMSGAPISGQAAGESGLVDAVASENDLIDAACAFALRLAEAPLRRIRDMAAPTSGEAALFAAARAEANRRYRGFAAPLAVIDAVEAAATRPFDEALAVERALFDHLQAGDQSAAQRHIFFAERQAARVADIPETTPTMPIRQVGIVGAGTMGRGIAMAFANAGLGVTLVEHDAAALDRGLATIRKTYEATRAKGRLTEPEVAARLSHIRGTLDLSELAPCDLIVEAVFEEMAAKQELFGALDRIAKPDAFLASNTSYLDIDAIAAATTRPAQVLGLHFFSPAHVMRLLEIVRGKATGAGAIATTLALAKRIGKVPVVVGNAHGFVGNRMLAVRQREANALILEGATPWDVDRVLVAFGLPMGPFAMADLAGLDLGWSRSRSTGATLRERLCELGRRGQKTGRGFYDYDEARRPTPSPEVDALVRAFAAEQGIVPRAIGDDEILARLLYPMINEGVKALEEGIAQRASDIDVVWVNGYGWPAYRGGPMFYADQIGLKTIRDWLVAASSERGAAMAPSSLLVQSAESGRGLSAHRERSVT
jgi:3-hydroxyacyl-CoA dehydrogenase